MNESSRAVEEKTEQHATRVNGWCFCAECNEAREDIARYDDGPETEADARSLAERFRDPPERPEEL
jgi:hypothetical protein